MILLLALAGCVLGPSAWDRWDEEHGDLDGDGYSREVDCDDDDPAVHPGADEVCDGVDQDCDGTADEDAVDAPTWYSDGDGDGYGVDVIATLCAQPVGGVELGEDCDDGRADVHPGADEVCDGVDQDCDDVVDEDATDQTAWYPDEDGDGFGDLVEAELACEAPAGMVAVSGDCNDDHGGIYPGAVDPCDGLDRDCDGDDGGVDFSAGLGMTTVLTDVFAGGSPTAPVRWSNPSDGTLTFCPGTWYAYLVLDGEVSVKGRSGSDSTVLYSGGAVGVRVVGGEVDITGLTLTGADRSAEGGAVYVADSASVSIRQTVIDDNRATLGSALLVNGGEASLAQVEVTDNQGTAIAVTSGVVGITDSVVSGNTGSNGGAIASTDSAVSVLRSDVYGNTAARGGCAWLYGSGYLNVDESSLHGADASTDGGCIYAAGGVTVYLYDSVLSDNFTMGEGGGAWVGDGAVLDCTSSDTWATHGITNNTATGRGGGGGVYLGANGSLTSTRCDWGAGAVENTPDDVAGSGFSQTGYRDNAVFACDSSGCDR